MSDQATAPSSRSFLSNVFRTCGIALLVISVLIIATIGYFKIKEFLRLRALPTVAWSFNDGRDHSCSYGLGTNGRNSTGIQLIDATIYYGTNVCDISANTSKTFLYGLDTDSGAQKLLGEYAGPNLKLFRHGDNLIFGAQDEIRAVNRNSGDATWVVARPNLESLATNENGVFALTLAEMSYSMQAYNPTTGKKNWEITLPKEGSPQSIYAVKNAILVDSIITSSTSSSDGLYRLYAFSPDDGQPLWQFEPDSLLQGVAESENTIFVGSNGVVALNTADGSEKWNFGSYRTSAIIADNGTVYTAVCDRLIALDESTGIEKWGFDIFDLGGNCIQSFTPAPNGVWVGLNGLVYRLNRDTGKNEYPFPLNPGQVNRPEQIVIDGKKLYFVSADQEIVAFDLKKRDQPL